MMTTARWTVLVGAVTAAGMAACIDFDGAIADCENEGGCRSTAGDGGDTQDAGADGGAEDAGADGGTDAGVDGGTDAGVDAGFDAGADAGTDDAGPTDAGTWQLHNVQALNFEPTGGVWASAPDRAFVTGFAGRVTRWTGTTWVATQLMGVGGEVTSIWGHDDELYAADLGSYWARYTNDEWESGVLTGTVMGPNWIHGLPDGGSLHAAMEGPQIASISPAGQWSIAWDGGTSGSNSLYGIFVIEEDLAYAAGADGRVVALNGQTWSPVNVNTAQHLFRVWASGPDDVWVVGNGGVVRHFNGSTWTTRNHPGGANLRGVWGDGDGNAYVAGHSGVISRYDGAGWQDLPTGTTTLNFRGLWGGGPKDLFAPGVEVPGTSSGEVRHLRLK